jgi:hypothetical protein
MTMQSRATLKLREDILKFLNEEFVFRKLEIHTFFGIGESPIFWIHRRNYHTDAFNTADTCTLLDDHVFNNWKVCDKDTVTYLLDEFEWNSLNNDRKLNRRAAKEFIRTIIEEPDFVPMISFNPVLKKIISGGRHKVRGVVPLDSTDSRRINIHAKAGEGYYLCNDYHKPYLANPCYVIGEGTSGTYRIMFFTNVASQFLDTKKLEINGYGFTTVFANELGTTLEQAVIQKQG